MYLPMCVWVPVLQYVLVVACTVRSSVSIMYTILQAMELDPTN
jgi:hypothetical protein